MEQTDAFADLTSAGPGYRSAAARRDDGKTLRRKIPREKQGGWKARRGRRDTVDILIESNRGRLPGLIPIRHGRMLQSPFAYYRGSAACMAADLAQTPSSGLRVQACGDAHLMNFGGFATPERQHVFDINDLDETLPAPWEWDLKRLAASLVIAGRHIDLRERDCAAAAQAAARSYREHMSDYSEMRAIDVWYDKIDIDRLIRNAPTEQLRKRAERRIEEARSRSVPDEDFPKLVEHQGSTPRIKDNPPLIFHPAEETKEEYAARAAEALNLYRRSMSDHVRVLFDKFTFIDIAVKVVGVGSVGTMCFVALFLAGDDDPLFLQFKQANPSVLEPYVGKSVYPNHGQRVVAGQRLMQSASDIFLGWTEGSKSGRHFYGRQLRDMKISAMVEGFDAETLAVYGEFCGWALARAHARSGDPAMIYGYMGSSDTFDRMVCEFAVEYADQNEEDYARFARAVREGRIQAIAET